MELRCDSPSISHPADPPVTGPVAGLVWLLRSSEPSGLLEGDRSKEGEPSTAAGLAPAARIDPPILLAAATGFLLFLRQVHALLGHPGPVRVEARVSGGDHYLATVAPPAGAEPRFFFGSEHTEIRSSVEAEQQDLAGREVALAEQIMTRLVWHFGIEAFGQ